MTGPRSTRDDEREALIDAMLEVPFIRDYDWLGTGSRWPSDEWVRHEVGELVDAYEAATASLRKHPEPEITNEMVEAAWAVIERDGLTVLERGHVRAALEAALRVPDGAEGSGEGEQQ